MAEGLLYFHKTLGEKFLLIYLKLNKGNLVYSFPNPLPLPPTPPWRNRPQQTTASSFSMLHDHTQTLHSR